MLIAFDDFITAAISGQESFTIPDNWSQGRTVYGGLTAAVIYSAMRSHVAKDRLIRSAQIAFIGPVLPDQPLQVSIESLRQGKALSQLQGTITQNQQVCAQMYASFGTPLASSIGHHSETLQLPASFHRKATSQPVAPPDIMPKFVNQFDISFAEGALPFSGSRHTTLGGFMRYREAPKQFHEAHLIGIIDCWPPATLPMTTQFGPASTVTWTIDFVQPQPFIDPEDHLGYLAKVRHCSDGYGYTSAQVWNKNNELVAISNQTVLTYG